MIQTGSKKKDGKICHANTNPKKAGMAILTADRADFRAKKAIREKDII